MGDSTEKRDKALAAEHAFTRKLHELDEEAERRKQAFTSQAASKVGGVEKDYKVGLDELQKTRQAQEAKEGEAHKKRISKAKATHQSELRKIKNDFNSDMDAMRRLKRMAIKPIEEELSGNKASVDEWRFGAGAVAEQEHLEALAKIETEHPEE